MCLRVGEVELCSAQGMTLLSSGDLLVADMHNHRLRLLVRVADMPDPKASRTCTHVHMPVRARARVRIYTLMHALTQSANASGMLGGTRAVELPATETAAPLQRSQVPSTDAYT